MSGSLELELKAVMRYLAWVLGAKLQSSATAGIYS